MSHERHAARRDELTKQVLEAPGHTAPALRAAAARGEGLPEELGELVRKIHQHAYKVTDEDLARLKTRYSDDELFEVIVSAAMGASLERLFAGLRALEETT
jgi:hypothetical protein